MLVAPATCPTTPSITRLIRSAAASFLIAALGVGAGSSAVHAQTYPDKPIRLLISVPAGAGPDVEGRQFAQALAQELGQPIVVENKPGNSQMLAMEALTKSVPDGYTLAMGSPSNLSSSPRLYDRPLYSVEKDIAAISQIGQHPWVLYVNANLPVKTLADFIALAKSQPGKVSMATTGVGSFAHITSEWFQKLSGTQLLHVPYGAANWQTDLMAGHVDATFYPLFLADSVKSGKLRALAISSNARSPKLPDVPTFVEAGLPEFAARAWFGLVAPAGTPTAILEKLAAASGRAMQNLAFREFMTSLGILPVGSSAPEFAQFLKTEQARWRTTIAESGIKVE